jgi:hypothetical protein
MKWLFGACKFTLGCVLLLSLSCVPVSFGCPGANQPPTAAIDSITPDTPAAGAVISFTGHGTDPNGTVVAYRWRSSLNGEISAMASFGRSDLSAGTHIIYLKVQDNNGAWSKEDSKTITITAAGTAGTSGGTAGPDGGPAGLPVIAFFNANPSYIAAGDYSTLSWNVTGASVVSIDNGIGDVAAVGSQYVTPTATTSYTMVAKNNAGANFVNTQVVVVPAGSGPPPPGVPVINQFVSDADTLSGAYVTLSWNVSNATSITISPTVGSVSAIGNRQVTPAATTIYTLTATNAAGSANRTLQVTVPGSGLTGPGVTGTVTPLPHKVTSVITAVTPTSYELECPYTFHCSAMIRVNGPCTVTYIWQRSDGGSSPTQTEVFTAAGVKEVSTGWPRETSGSYWVKVKILSPNSLTSNQANFNVACFH